MLTYFIIYAIIILVIVSLSILVVATTNHYHFYEMKSILVKAVIISLAISAVLAVLRSNAHNIDIEDYNNGYCTECGGELTLFDIEKSGRYGMNVTYYYQCEDCGHTIYTFESME